MDQSRDKRNPSLEPQDEPALAGRKWRAKRMKRRTLFAILLIVPVLSVVSLWAATGSQMTMTLGTTPGNPTAGKVRLWANTATGFVECLTSLVQIV